MQTPEQHKAEILAHCLWMATLDPEYAKWAAEQYERREPVLMKNLAAKVAQEVKRSTKSSSPCGPSAP